MAPTPASDAGKGAAAGTTKSSSALLLALARCHLRWLKTTGTKGIVGEGEKELDDSAALEALVSAIGHKRFLDYLCDGWARMREEDLAALPGTKLEPPSDQAKDAMTAWTTSGWPRVHFDVDAMESIRALGEKQVLTVLGRLAAHLTGSTEGAELLAEEGDYCRIYETVCAGDIRIFWGPALLMVSKELPKITSVIRLPLFALDGVCRIYSIAAGASKRRQVLLQLLRFFSTPPSAQVPWHVYGPPLAERCAWPRAEGLSARQSAGGVHMPEPDDKPRRPSLRVDSGDLLRAVNPEHIRRFFEVVGGSNLTEEEKVAGAAGANSLVIGRSGTGKTTVAMLRMAALELLRAPTDPPPQTVFLTASPVLSSEVLRSFVSMRNHPGLRAVLRQAGFLRVNFDPSGSQEDGAGVAAADASSAVGAGPSTAAELTSDAAAAASSRPVASSASRRRGGSARGATSNASARSLGSWFALGSAATGESFELVDAQEVYDMATEAEEDAEEENQEAEEEKESSEATGKQEEKAEDGNEQEDEEEEDEEDEEETEMWASHAGNRLPGALKEAVADDFPMFLTVRQLLHMLDAGLSKPFFARDQHLRPMGVDVCTWQPEGGGAQLVNEWLGGSKWQPSGGQGTEEGAPDDVAEGAAAADDLLRSRVAATSVRSGSAKAAAARQGRGQHGAAAVRCVEIGYEYFAEVMWPTLSAGRVLPFQASLVWTEIMAHIKGSQEAFALGGSVPREQYVGAFGRKRTPMTEFQRKTIYDIYQSYEGLKAQAGGFDEADFVHYLRRHLQAEGYVGPELRSIVIDEVQDISQAALRLILEVAEPQRGGLYFCGDAAQTISKGLAFRLCDLRSAFIEGPRQSKHDAPGVLRLTRNFRSAAPVLRVANCVLKLLCAFFPNSVDHGGEESAAEGGGSMPSAPTPCRVTSLDELLAASTGSGLEDGARPAFGADLVVIVREQAQKADLPELLQHCLVMTVWEAKGLEFDTVVLLDFFRHAQADWSVLGVLPDASSTPCVPDGWDADANALLCCELKQLYVAITRAKRRVLFFDQPPHLGARGVWGEALVSDGAQSGGASSTAASRSQEAWRAQGRRLLRLGFATQAELCFTWSCDEQLRQEAEATKLAKDAARAQARAAITGSEDGQEAASEAVRQQFLRAAALFDSCSRSVHAAKCLAAAGDWREAAERFHAAGRWDEAAVAFLRSGQPGLAARCFEQGGQWSRALEAWKAAGSATDLLRCAGEALRGRVGNREECLAFVRQAVDGLESADAVCEAASLLGGPAVDAPHSQVADFLASELGAEAAALRLLADDPQSIQESGGHRLSLAIRAFFRSVVRGDPAWDLLAAGSAGSSSHPRGLDRTELMACLFGLSPPDSAGALQPPTTDQGSGPFQPPSRQDLAKLKASSPLPARAAALQLLLARRLGDEDAIAAASDAYLVADLASADVLLAALSATPLQLGQHLSCIRVATSAGELPLLKRALPLSEAWQAAPVSSVLQAARARAGETVNRTLLKRHAGSSSPEELLEATRSLLTVRFCPPPILYRAVERLARAAWLKHGPAAAVPCAAETAGRLRAALLAAALDVLRAEPGGTAVTRAFVILIAGEESLLDVLLECREARGHQELVTFARRLQAGLVESAAQALAKYLASDVDMPCDFAVSLAAFLVGPCTAAFPPKDGAYVLQPLLWDWPAVHTPRERGAEQVDSMIAIPTAAERLATSLASIREALLSRARKAVVRGMAPKRATKKKDTSRRKAPGLNFYNALDDGLDEELMKSHQEPEVDFLDDWHEAVDAQLRYSSGESIEQSWWDEAEWSEELQPPAAGAAAAKAAATVKAAAEARLAEGTERSAKRKQAAEKIGPWIARRWRLRAAKDLWPPFENTCHVLQRVRLAQPSQVEPVVVCLERCLLGEVPAAAVGAATAELSAMESELLRRAHGAREREAIEHSRRAREVRREVQRQRGERRREYEEIKNERRKLQKRLMR